MYTVTFSPDGRSLISGSDDNSVRLWNIRDGSFKKLPARRAGFVVSVVFSPDGRYIAAGDLDKWLWIWASRTHKLIANWEGHRDCVWCVKFTPDGKGLISGGSDQTVNYWDVSSLYPGEREVVASGQSFPLIRSFSGHSVSLYNFSPLNVDFDFRRAAFSLLRSFPATLNYLSLVHKIEACVCGTSALVSGS